MEPISFKNSNWKYLNFSKNALGEDFGNQLLYSLSQNCKDLISIFFYDCCLHQNIHQNLIKLIEKNPNLQEINFDNNFFGREKGELIFQELTKFCHDITFLSFFNCGLHQPFPTFDILEIFNKNVNMTSLDLGNNLIGEETGIRILKLMASNFVGFLRVYFENCNFTCAIQSALTNFIEKNKNLEVLDISNNFLGCEFGKDLFECLANVCSSMLIINCENCGFDKLLQKNIELFVKNNGNLEAVNLNNNSLTSIVGKSLFNSFSSAHCQIKEIQLENCELDENIQEEFINFIRNNKVLERINLKKNNLKLVKKEVFEIIFDSCKRLKTFELNDCQLQISNMEFIVNEIYRLNCIQNIDFGNCLIENRLGNILFKNLAENFTSLKQLMFNNCGFDDSIKDNLIKVCHNNRRIEELSFGKNHLTSIFSMNFFSLLTNNYFRISNLEFNSCKFNNNFVNSLLTIVENAYFLEKLNFGGINIGSKLGKVLLKKIGESCLSMKVLNFNNCSFDETIKDELIFALSRNKSLENVDIGKNYLNSEFGKDLFKLLISDCHFLKSLNLENCNFDEEISDEFFSFICLMEILECVNLTGNFLSGKIKEKIMETLSIKYCGSKKIEFKEPNWK